MTVTDCLRLKRQAVCCSRM